MNVLKRVLYNDPAMGFIVIMMRDNEEAQEVGKTHDLLI